MHFAIDTDGTSGGSLSFLEAMAHVYYPAVNVRPSRSYNVDVMVVVVREHVKLFGFEPQAMFMLIGDSKTIKQ